MSSVKRTTCFPILLLVGMCLYHSSALAGDRIEEQKQEAKRIVDVGIQQRNEGHYQEALLAFIEADLRFPSSSMLVYSIGRCWEELGRCAYAREAFELALVHPSPLPDDAKQNILAYLETNACTEDSTSPDKLARHRELVVSAIESFLIGEYAEALTYFERANHLLPSALGSLRVAQMAYFVGNCEKLRDAVVQAKTTLDLSLPELVEYLEAAAQPCVEPVVVVTDPSPDPDPQTENTDVSPDDTAPDEVALDDEHVEDDPMADVDIQDDLSREGLSPVPWIVGGVAVAALITAAVLYARADELQQEFDDEVTQGQVDTGRADEIWSDIETNELAFNVLLWGGIGVGLAAGVLFFVLDTDEGQTEDVTFAPAIAPGHFGVTITAPF